MSEDVLVEFPEKVFLPLCQNRYQGIKTNRKPRCIKHLVKENISLWL